MEDGIPSPGLSLAGERGRGVPPHSRRGLLSRLTPAGEDFLCASSTSLRKWDSVRRVGVGGRLRACVCVRDVRHDVQFFRCIAHAAGVALDAAGLFGLTGTIVRTSNVQAFKVLSFFSFIIGCRLEQTKFRRFRK